MTPVAASSRHPEKRTGSASHVKAAAHLPLLQAQAGHFPETLHSQGEEGKPFSYWLFLSSEDSKGTDCYLGTLRPVSPALTTAPCLSLWLYEVTDLFLALCQVGKIPIPPPRKTRAQLLDDILIRMRDPRNVTEAPLGMAPVVPPG